MSGAYVDQELAVEFGNLPPAFLPLGNSRLYEAQLTGLGDLSNLFMTLPAGFVASGDDLRRLGAAGVSLLPLPSHLSLGEAVAQAIALAGGVDGPVRILHGDTLLLPMPPSDETDIVAVSAYPDPYRWAEVLLEGERIGRVLTPAPGLARAAPRLVACGYFCLSTRSEFVDALHRADGDFVAALDAYAQRRPMRTVHIDNWYDFGHVHTLFRSRRIFTSGRSFNTLTIGEHVAHKTAAGEQHFSKIRAEAQWLTGVPPAVQVYVARVLDTGECFAAPYYTTEYEYSPTLAELFVFGALEQISWRHIIRSCAEFLDVCGSITRDQLALPILETLAVDKTFSRLETFASSSSFDICQENRLDGRPAPSLLAIAESLSQIIKSGASRRQCIMHGDFCFSNILFNFRTRRIRALDPRGELPDGTPAIYGDPRYDLAKLAHSVFGRYDQIMSGRYVQGVVAGPHDFSIAFEEAPHHGWVEEAVRELQVHGVAAASSLVQATTISLFLSMLPIHDDSPERQRAFIANALRLYATMEAKAS
jgi:hypothetical protein